MLQWIEVTSEYLTPPWRRLQDMNLRCKLKVNSLVFWKIASGGLIITDGTTKVLLFKKHFCGSFIHSTLIHHEWGDDSEEDLQMLKSLSASADVYSCIYGSVQIDRTMIMNALVHF
jgi:hypothetical protein